MDHPSGFVIGEFTDSNMSSQVETRCVGLAWNLHILQLLCAVDEH